MTETEISAYLSTFKRHLRCNWARKALLSLEIRSHMSQATANEANSSEPHSTSDLLGDPVQLASRFNRALRPWILANRVLVAVLLLPVLAAACLVACQLTRFELSDPESWFRSHWVSHTIAWQTDGLTLVRCKVPTESILFYYEMYPIPFVERRMNESAGTLTNEYSCNRSSQVDITRLPRALASQVRSAEAAAAETT